MKAKDRATPTKMNLLVWRLLPSLEKRNTSTPMRMPVASLIQLLLFLIPQDWVTQSKAKGRAKRTQASRRMSGSRNPRGSTLKYSKTKNGAMKPRR